MGKKCTAIVLAAGQGKRMGGKIRKQFLKIAGHPILYYSLNCFETTPFIQEVILVTEKEYVDYCKKEIVDKYHLQKVVKIVPGGKERYDSVYAGLLSCCETDYVFIHDGARPFISREILERALDGVSRFGACVVGMPSKDTVKLVDEKRCVSETPDRGRVWTVQTPQVFDYALVCRAYEKMQRSTVSGITDDAMVVERFESCMVRMVEGSYRNIKITTPEDLLIAEAFLQENK